MKSRRLPLGTRETAKKQYDSSTPCERMIPANPPNRAILASRPKNHVNSDSITRPIGSRKG